MAKPNVSMLGLALRKITSSKPEKSAEVTGSSESTSSANDLEKAMGEFAAAKTDADRAKTFKAALELAKS